MRVAVIGGGVAGLTAAHALVGAGIDAHVLEASHRPGGVVGTSELDGFVREHAASSFLGGPARGALALCDELGVPVEKASPRAKNRFIYIDGALRALPRSPIGLVRSDLLTWRGKLALVREPFAPPRAPGVDESVHAFAARRFGPEAARAIFAPFVTGVFAADSHDVSLEAGFPRFAALDDEGGIVRGVAKTAGRALLARVTGKKSEGTRRGLYAPAGGLGALVDALVATLGSRVQTRTRVTSLAPTERGILVDGESYDAAVLATAAADAIPLVAPALPELATKLRAFTRAPVALVYVGCRTEEVPVAGTGFGALVAAGEDARVLGIVFESTVWPGRAPGGDTLLRCIYGGGRDPSAASLPESELRETALRDVERVLGGRVTPIHVSIVRWPHGLAQYGVGHRDLVRAATAAARSQRIVLAGADYRGTGINDLCADRDVILSELRTWM